MITNLHDFNIAIDNAIYGEEIIVNKSMYEFYLHIWDCIFKRNIEIKNLKIINGESND